MFTFSTSRAQYLEDGKPFDKDKLKHLLLLFLALLEDELQEITDQMTAGEMDLGEWQRRATELVKSGLVAASMLGRGGAGLLQGPSRRLAESDIRFSLTRLARFARLIEERTMPRARDPLAIRNRIALYAKAGAAAFEQASRFAHQSAGFKFEKNVLGAAEHCGQCLEETAKGLVRIGTLRPVGSRTCRMNCRCRIVYSR